MLQQVSLRARNGQCRLVQGHESDIALPWCSGRLRAGVPVNAVGGDGSSNSVPEEEEDGEDSTEWGLEKGMSLFEVSAKDDYGKL